MGGSQTVTGIAWYRRDQWLRLLDVSVDRDKLEASYEEWLTSAQHTLSEMAVAGVHPRKVDVDVDALVDWCQTQGRSVDATARAEFVVRKLRQAEGERDA